MVKENQVVSKFIDQIDEGVVESGDKIIVTHTVEEGSKLSTGEVVFSHFDSIEHPEELYYNIPGQVEYGKIPVADIKKIRSIHPRKV
ncbi:MAG: hypothetical protein ABH851_07660 [Methanobacteriota archaeon]